MPDIAWQQHNNLYTASISDFRAVITERHDTATFAAQVETVDREILREWEPLPNFETAARCVLAMMVDVEQTLDTHNPYRRLFETLDLCQAKLTATAEPIHVQRLKHIRHWVATRDTQEQEIADEWRQRSTDKQ